MHTDGRFERGHGRCRAGLLAMALCIAIAGCEQQAPRSFADFIEDQAAMEGTIARCNADRGGTVDDLECANARRAAAALALAVERSRREELERESERRIAELSAELARREQAERDALAAAERAKREAYEALWNAGLAGDHEPGTAAADAVPTEPGARDLAAEPGVGAAPE